MTQAKSSRSKWARGWLLLIGLWIFTGAFFKIFFGTPGDLPAVLHELPLPLDLTYRAAIAAELIIVMLCFLKPRWAWPVVTATLALFLVILTTQMGQESCGCFGARVTVPPWLMMTIDGLLLVVLLSLRPWSALWSPGAQRRLVFVCGLVLGIVPWLLNVQGGGVVSEDGRSLPRWIEMDITEWQGKDIRETVLAQLIPGIDQYPMEGRWVFYRQTCPHCADHLREMAWDNDGFSNIVVVRLVEKHDSEENRLVDEIPEGPNVVHLEISPEIDILLTTPAEISLSDGIILEAREAIGVE